MRGNREWVLVLVLLAALHCTLTAAEELDMSADAVDDRYEGCRADALKALPDRLKAELAGSPEFTKAWEARWECTLVVPGGLPLHSRALMAFERGGNAFRTQFDQAVATMGGNHSFPFSALHFLLTDAIQLLSGKGTAACRTVYAVTPRSYSPQKGATVKLGAFTPVSTDVSLLLEDPAVDGGVLFNITSCLAPQLDQTGCWEAETLLLPAEEYTVEDVHQVVDEDNYSYTSVTLKHSGFSSKHNCYLTPRSLHPSSSTGVVGCMWAVFLAAAGSGLLN